MITWLWRCLASVQNVLMAFKLIPRPKCVDSSLTEQEIYKTVSLLSIKTGFLFSSALSVSFCLKYLLWQ